MGDRNEAEAEVSVDAGAIAGDDPSRLETPEVVQHTAKTAQEECMDVEIREAR